MATARARRASGGGGSTRAPTTRKTNARAANASGRHSRRSRYTPRAVVCPGADPAATPTRRRRQHGSRRREKRVPARRASSVRERAFRLPASDASPRRRSAFDLSPKLGGIRSHLSSPSHTPSRPFSLTSSVSHPPWSFDPARRRRRRAVPSRAPPPTSSTRLRAVDHLQLRLHRDRRLHLLDHRPHAPLHEVHDRGGSIADPGHQRGGRERHHDAAHGLNGGDPRFGVFASAGAAAVSPAVSPASSAASAVALTIATVGVFAPAFEPKPLAFPFPVPVPPRLDLAPFAGRGVSPRGRALRGFRVLRLRLSSVSVSRHFALDRRRELVEVWKYQRGPSGTRARSSTAPRTTRGVPRRRRPFVVTRRRSPCSLRFRP